MNILILLGLFVLGAMFGSFGSVILTRMEKKIKRGTIKGFLVGRSHCPNCKHTLAWYDLIPIYSRFSNKGKCRYCGKNISSMYPTLEIVSGLVFVLWGMMYFLPYMANRGSLHILILVAWRLLGLLLVRDMYTYYLHTPVRFILCVVLIVQLVIRLIHGSFGWEILWNPVLFLGFFLGIYWLGWWYTRVRFGKSEEAFGQGDVMLAPLIGLLFAFEGIPYDHYFQFLLIYIVIACLAGLLHYGIAWLVIKFSKNKKSGLRHQHGSPMIPFLPAMVIAYWFIVISSFVV